MGVKVKLADTREVLGQKYAAGDVVDLEPGDARVLVATGAGVRVDDSSGETVPAAAGTGSAGRSATVPAPEPGAAVASAQIKPGETGRKG